MANRATEQNGKVDLRVVKTKAAIRNAFLTLLATTPYSSITVTAIAEQALIGRKTFYKHYPSIATLVEEMAQDEISSTISNIQIPEGPLDIRGILEKFTVESLTALHNMPGLDENFIRSITLPRFLALVKPPLIGACAREMELRGIEMTPEFNFWSSYYLGGLCSVYETWKNEPDGMSLEDVALMVSRSAADGLERLVEGRD